MSREDAGSLSEESVHVKAKSIVISRRRRQRIYEKGALAMVVSTRRDSFRLVLALLVAERSLNATQWMEPAKSNTRPGCL
jgi:hypothetical protein